jgi:uncharacterized protein (DUF2225 family)
MTEPIWIKEVKCPACDAVFKTARVKPSALKVKAGEADFHKIYENINPLLYAVTSCPNCNYSARNDDFDDKTMEYHPEIVKLAMAIKDSKKNIRFQETKEIDIETAVKKHLLAITFAKQYKPMDPLTVAGLYMHIAWMYREQGNKDKDLEYQKFALEYYIMTFEKGSHIPEKIGEPGIIYLIGELNRVLGNYSEAVTWFSRVVKHDQISNFPNIENLARDAWEKITEEKRKNQNQDSSPKTQK